MTPDELEEIKKSYVFKNAKDVSENKLETSNTFNIKNAIQPIEEYIKLKYPQYWNQYMEGKMYSNSNEIIENILFIINKLVSNSYKEKLLQNSELEKESKQIIISILDNQSESIYKLNKIYNNIKIDTNPIIIYLLSLFLNRI